jgi:hypothetical protein
MTAGSGCSLFEDCLAWDWLVETAVPSGQLEDPGADVHKKCGMIPSISTFFSVTALVNAPLVSSAGGPTLACYVWWMVHCDTNKAVECDDNVTSVNFL